MSQYTVGVRQCFHSRMRRSCLQFASDVSSCVRMHPPPDWFAATRLVALGVLCAALRSRFEGHVVIDRTDGTTAALRLCWSAGWRTAYCLCRAIVERRAGVSPGLAALAAHWVPVGEEGRGERTGFRASGLYIYLRCRIANVAAEVME